ncbi:MAG TPA: DUF2207 domain-containing protein [Thermodesulfovibrionales bacterium]|nr:DUF2207 domain-containing protein [Thermodesulfovibrionales bacterium]
MKGRFARSALILTLTLTIFSSFVIASGKHDIDQMLKEKGYQSVEVLNKPPFTGTQDFTINKFHSSIAISEDSSFTVKETIDVEFHRPRHGIYREIPYKYRDDLGKTIKTPLDVLSVTDKSGKGWKYRVSRTGNVINIRIGDANTYVSGDQTYVITYKVENAILFFDNHDELYWNVTGNYWNAPINEASADVSLAIKNESKNLWAACYTGVYGSKKTDCSFEASHNSADFFTKKNLNTGEGITIAFGWDKGLVSPPSAWKKFLWTMDLKENWIFSLPLLSFFFMLNLWYRKGRDPKVREAVAVMYEPPKYDNKILTPAEVGTLIDENVDSRDLTSAIIGLAVKGYIKIKETKKEGLIFDSTDYYLSGDKGPDENLSSFERELMDNLFSDSPSGIFVSDMKNKFYKNLQELKDTLYRDLVEKKYFLRSPEKVRNVYITAGILTIIFGSMLTAFLITSLTVKTIISWILAGLPIFSFGRVMPAKTKVGASAYIDILGFQEFLNRAEKDRLERMGDKNLFSKFLPYAIALGVEDNWAKAFEGVYQEPPNWYVSPGGFRAFSPYGFSHSIGSMTSSLASAMFSSPRGSGVGSGGFGGGGSSGGGFGGGGGGSW